MKVFRVQLNAVPVILKAVSHTVNAQKFGYHYSYQCRSREVMCNITIKFFLIVVHIMGTSDLPDMYTQARGLLGPRTQVYVNI